MSKRQTMQPIVSVRAVEKWYDEGSQRRHVLHGVDMHISAGECVALVGKSGSGKSSLLNIISGIDRADAGAVTVDGYDVLGMDETARTRFRRHS
ncbi:ATP-binding cassette domain-containing protein, partial [Salmonella enterica]|uniref:ATP-binding cassette domain-containing protein n=1 Tax=Salmonella enterica TaxID=28901 RepID=UPI003524BFE0